MGLTYFNLALDSPTATYYPATNLTGRVEFSLDYPETLRAVVIEIVGVATTSWSEEVTRTNDNNENKQFSDPTITELVNYTASEECFSEKFNLAGGPNVEMQLPASYYKYPFSTMLPPQLTSSFESKHGNIRYTVRAILDLAWDPVGQMVEKMFTVLTLTDLNYNAKAKEPVKLAKEKTFCCLWCKSGPLAMVISLPYTGFVPGQKIPVTVEVDNASNVRVDNVVIKLNKVLKWIAREPNTKEKSHSDTLVEVSLGAVDCKRSNCFPQQIKVPEIPVYNLDQCSIITCSYKLEVIAEVSGAHINLDGEVPISLGTVPISRDPAAGIPATSTLPPTAPISFNINPPF